MPTKVSSHLCCSDNIHEFLVHVVVNNHLTHSISKPHFLILFLKTSQMCCQMLYRDTLVARRVYNVIDR